MANAADAANARAHACKVKAELQLDFCCVLAERMLFNNLNDDGKVLSQVEQQKTFSTVDKEANGHNIEKRPLLTENGVTKKGHQERSKIATKGYFATVYGAKSIVNPFCMIRRSKCTWNATKSDLSIGEVQ